MVFNGPQGRFDLDEKHILVVDDEANIRKVVSDVLKKTPGYAVETASDGQEALEFLRTRNFECNLVITDMMMPRMNGHDLILALREEAPQVATLILTAHKNDSNVIACLEAGAFDYVEKPISVEGLMSTVRRALERHERYVGRPDEVEVHQEMLGWVELTAPSDFEYVERFQKFTALLGNTPLSDEAREDIRVAIDELGQNAIEWGNRENREKQIRLSYCIFEDRIVFKIEDEGGGFDPNALGDPSVDPLQHIMNRMAEGKRAGGYGIYITRQLMDEIMYNERGNTVILTKLFNPPETAEAGKRKSKRIKKKD